jgi:hypothetical protein
VTERPVALPLMAKGAPAMAIKLPIFEDAAFDPEATGILVEAYEKACQSLHEIGEPGVVRELIAKRIIEDARKGERDPIRLCDRALKTLHIFGGIERC